ncbi:MAG TPA: hypothetical protein VM388_13575, partial [Acidimicrobiales bacterium]|nr:hypothetical protein [Acidimicrobiales bacterium]
MADPRSKLSVLVDPPLAEPPPVADLRRRGKAWRRRTAASRGGLAAAVAVVLAAAGMALVPGDTPQTLQTAAPPSSTAGADPSSPAVAESATVPIRAFDVDGQAWTMLATRTADPAICFTLQPAAGEALRPGCLTAGAGAVQAGAADLRSATLVFGIVAPDVSVVTLSADGNASPLEVMGAGAGFPVNFVATVVPPSVKAVDLTATRGGREEGVSVTLPTHSRAPSGNGGEVAPSAPASTTVAPARP